MENKTQVESIDAYIASFPAEIQQTLQTLRQVIKETAPEASEKISYQLPTFALHGNLVHFAAFKNHIGFYPGAGGIAAFQQELFVRLQRSERIRAISDRQAASL